MLKKAIEASIAAGKAILGIYDKPDLGIEVKNDDSPLTLADIASNDVISKYLKETAIPIISEENKQVDFSIRQQWNRCWIVDPLDGTKEFIKRNGEFTVNIALVSKGIPTIGVIYVPVSRELYFTSSEGNKAYKASLKDDHSYEEDFFSDANEISPSPNADKKIKVVGSRSHMNEETVNFVEGLKNNFNEVEIVSKGSSLKFCLVAEGKADIYPRFAPTMEWDTAAGHAICRAVGLKVISKETNEELKYNKKNLLNSYFVVKQ
ncbi:MAG: 3'(2'),5'-bisphosphate nucleotidase CysQ [Bacteroidota bacterium]